VNEVTRHYSSVIADIKKQQQGLQVPPKREAQQTVGGGGYSGYCDIENVKQLQIECAGLEGDAMEACWAHFGCDVNEVTRQYSSLIADIKKQQQGLQVPAFLRGHGRFELPK